MEVSGYERYGLSGNPFRDLSSETLEEIELLHVKQDLDSDFNVILDDLHDKINKNFIAITGESGVGKTHRLMLVDSIARDLGFFVVFETMDEKVRWAVESILETMTDKKLLKQINDGGILNGTPKWAKELIKIKKNLKKYSPESVGVAIANALNQNAPSALILNDMHNLPESSGLGMLARVLQIIADNIDDGVLILIGSDETYFENFINKYPIVQQRLNHKFKLIKMTDAEAGLMIAKRMIEKRLVDDMEPLYPFTDEAISLINNDSHGNPRELLRLASYVLDMSAQRRTMVIDDGLTAELLDLGKNKHLDVFKDKKKVERVVKKQKKKTKSKSISKIKKLKKLPSNPGLVPSGNPGPESSGNPGSSKLRTVKIKCPKCGNSSQIKVDCNTTRLNCPNPDCNFVGKIKN